MTATATATKALRLAQHLVEFVAEADIDNEGFDIDGEHYSAADLRHHMFRALESLRQGPLQVDAMEVHRRLLAASAKAGSDAALARQIGISRQALADMMSGKRQPGPAVLTFLKLRKVSAGRTLYSPVDDEVKAKAPRSERRQRAWDGPSGAVPDRVPAL